MDFIITMLDKASRQPLYHQLYSALVRDIRAGQLAAGEKLPGKRTAAAQLGVSVNTVDEAYQMLAAEGYVQAVPRSGFVVSRLQQMPAAPGPGEASFLPQGPAPYIKEADPVRENPPTKAPPSGAGAGTAAEGQSPWRYSFATGDLDPSLFPGKMWNRLLREVIAGEEGLLLRGEGAGDAVLRQAIAEYLRGWRGVRCDAAQLVVGAGLEVLVGMAARLLAQSTFALESPGYPKTAHILHNMGVPLRFVPVDAAGMAPRQLAKSGARVAYLTPSHQFPTGGVMPVGRRTELLRWAAEHDAYILEDDYDSEFRFDGRPITCLQGLDEAERVIYAGTFSRSLAPGLRAAYLVLPPRLLGPWQAMYGDYACTVSRPEQHTLALLMNQGHFARSLNRIRNRYRHRRDLLLASLKECLGQRQPAWQVEHAHTGLYFILRLPGQNAVALAKKARAAKLRLRALNEYYAKGQTANPATADALVVGYGGIAEADIPVAAAALAGILAPGG